MRPFVMLLLLMLASTSIAGGVTTYSLDPGTGAAGAVVNLRIDSSDGCFLAESHSVTRDAAQVEMRIVQTDQLPCLPAQMTPIVYPLGTFGPGTYELRVVVCVNAPEPCSVRATLPLVVFGSSGSPVVVPALSGALLALLSVAMLVLGAMKTRS